MLLKLVADSGVPCVMTSPGASVYVLVPSPLSVSVYVCGFSTTRSFQFVRLYATANPSFPSSR